MLNFSTPQSSLSLTMWLAACLLLFSSMPKSKRHDFFSSSSPSSSSRQLPMSTVCLPCGFSFKLREPPLAFKQTDQIQSGSREMIVWMQEPCVPCSNETDFKTQKHEDNCVTVLHSDETYPRGGAQSLSCWSRNKLTKNFSSPRKGASAATSWTSGIERTRTQVNETCIKTILTFRSIKGSFWFCPRSFPPSDWPLVTSDRINS